MSCIDFLRVPRLEWDDRQITYEIDFFPTNEQDIVEINKRNETLLTLPGKIIVAGKYHEAKDDYLMPFVALVDT